MKQPKPAAATIYPWLRANLGPRSLAPLTGQDSRALQAAVQIIELYSYDRDDTVLQAFALVVGRMQESTQELAYHAIAHILNWSDRIAIWHTAGLPPFENPRTCSFEPGGSARDLSKAA